MGKKKGVLDVLGGRCRGGSSRPPRPVAAGRAAVTAAENGPLDVANVKVGFCTPGGHENVKPGRVGSGSGSERGRRGKWQMVYMLRGLSIGHYL